MSSNFIIVLVDKFMNKIKEYKISRPKLFEDLKKYVEKNISKNFLLLEYLDLNDNSEIKNQEEYDLYAEHILYVRKIESGENISESMFTRNFNKLSESKKEKISLKYTCSICLELIKNEKPFFCYVCQKIFHRKCLEDWEKQLNERNDTLSCPNCRNKLPLKGWKEKLDFKENRENDAYLMSRMNDNSLNSNQYTEKLNESFEKILIQLNEIYTLINSEENQKIKDLINRLKSYITKPSTDDITYEILEQLKFIKNYIKCTNNNANNNKKEVNLQYVTKEEGIHNIFGQQFVIANANNITLIINGKPTELVDKYVLLKGKNIVKMIIKNDITILDYMFSECKSLVNIDELKNLDLYNITSIKNLFYNCESLENIKVLQNFNVSKCDDLSNIFTGCKLLTDISPLKYWNVSNCTNFSAMFNSCQSLYDITPLKNWNVSKSKDFSYMFRYDKSLSDIYALEKWNVSNSKTLKDMFGGCSFSYLYPLENWDVSNCENFSGMFYECILLNDLRPIQNWDVSNGKDFSCLFSHWKRLNDLKPMQNWDVSKSKSFQCMFYACTQLSDLRPLQNWNVSNCENFNATFYGLIYLEDLSPLRNWNVSKCTNFYCMFGSCQSLSDISPIINWNLKHISLYSCKEMFEYCNIDEKIFSKFNCDKY